MLKEFEDAEELPLGLLVSLCEYMNEMLCHPAFLSVSCMGQGLSVQGGWSLCPEGPWLVAALGEG